MLTDIIEEEFDIKEEEPWYDHQDLEHDLHLAAELGKNLLEQNRELEQRLQQMYTTNNEQLQEIEHLSKQVDSLRSVNDQHAKVYEQLDVTARDLEQKNQRLLLENRAAQLKNEGLTETVDGLQAQVDELQREIKKLKQPSEAPPDAPQPGHVQNLTCCNKCQLQMYSHEHYSALREEEHTDLLRSVDSLQAELSTERSLRDAAEQEADALAHNLSQLEPELALLEDYKDRLAEMEAEVEELRHRLRSIPNVECTQSLMPGLVFVSPEEDRQRGFGLMSTNDNVQGCFKQAEDVKHHGISLLNEMDAQYTALQEKYDTLLRHCESGMVEQNHKAAQTPVTGSPQTHTYSQGTHTLNDAPLPEYKVLFHEIFTFIQKSKKDIKENRIKPSQVV